jgi:hypothetical protein
MHRKWFIIGGVLLLAGIIIGYVVWSMNTWSGYEARYKGWQSDIKNISDTALSMPMKTDQEKTAKIAAFSSVATRIANEKESICKVNSLVGWQSFVGTYKTRQADCATMTSRLAAFSQKTQVITSYFNDEKTLTALIINQVNTSEELTEATWGAKLTAWQGARDAITKTSPSIAFKPVKAVALEKTNVIVTTWQELISAHEAKSKPKFTEAQTKLNDSYGALSTIATAGSSAFKSVSESLQTAYTVAFK